MQARADTFKFSESKTPILKMLSKGLQKNKSKLYSQVNMYFNYNM
jgi:hypothetical protein